MLKPLDSTSIGASKIPKEIKMDKPQKVVKCILISYLSILSLNKHSSATTEDTSHIRLDAEAEAEATDAAFGSLFSPQVMELHLLVKGATSRSSCLVGPMAADVRCAPDTDRYVQRIVGLWTPAFKLLSSPAKSYS